jgi:hypothetical protein
MAEGGSSKSAGVVLAGGLAIASSLLCGCATIFTGTSDTLTFDSNAPKVRLSIDGKYKGELPLKVEMSRNFMGGQRFEARFEADGYETQEFRLDRAFNGVAVLDITSTTVSGGIDLLTGSLMMFSPRDYHVQMVPSGSNNQSVDLQRSADVYRFALTNCSAIKRDIARGGGEYLATLAKLLSRGEDGPAHRIERASLVSRDYLVGVSDPPTFVRRYGEVLARDPALRAYGL